MVSLFQLNKLNLIKKIVLLFLIITFIIVTHWKLLPGYLMQPSDGARAVYLDYHWIAGELISGNFPTWLPYYYGGLPFPSYGGGVIDINLIPFFFFPPDTAATIMMLSQILGLFIVLFLWLRMFGFSEVSSFLVVGLVIWSGPIMFWHGYGFPYNAFIYAVLGMILVEKYHRRGNSWYLFLLSCTVALSALSMSMQHQLNVPIAIIIAAIVRLVMDRHMRPFVLTLLFLGIGYSMAASHLLPLFHSLSEVGRSRYNYGETFYFSPILLFLAVWSGKGASIKYPPIYFFISPLLLVGLLTFFVRKCGEKYERTFILTGLVIFALFIAPMYIVPLIFSAYRIVDPYRQWFILILVFAVASASITDVLWKDINSREIMPRHYWVTSIIMILFLLLFKGLESYIEVNLLSLVMRICFFLFPVGVLPFLYLIRKTWIRSAMLIILFGCSYYFIGYQIRHEYVMTLSLNPNGYKELGKDYDDLHKNISPGAVFSTYNLRYWGEFGKVGPLEPSLSSLWSIRVIGGPTGFLFLPNYVKDAYYKDGIIFSPGNDFWRIVYPQMVSTKAEILARYGVEVLLVDKKDVPEFVAKANGVKLAELNNVTQEQINSDRAIWNLDSKGEHRYYILIIDNGHADGYFNSFAELVFFDGKRTITSSNIRIFADSNLGCHFADNLFDGDIMTFWHISMDRLGKQNFLLIDFGKKVKISRIMALKRQSYNNQFWKNASFYALPAEYKYIVKKRDGKLAFNENDPSKNCSDDNLPYILLLNQKYVGRAYIQNDDGSLRGLPLLIDTAKHVAINVHGLSKGTRVVLADNYYKGWQVSVDGILVRPDTSSHFRSVILPDDASVVEWSYSSKYVIIGFAISILSLLTAICCAAIIYYRDSKTK